MQDKDFDQLFKDKFADAEIAPSADLWNNIAGGLAPKAKKRVLPIYWMAAAVVLIAVTVGLLMPKTETIRLHGSSASVAEETSPVKAKPETVTTENLASNEEVTSTPLIIAPRLVVDNKLVAGNQVVGNKKESAVLQPIDRSAHLNDKQLKTVREPIVLPSEKVEPVKEVMIASVEQPVADKTNVITETEQPENKDRGIRNMGDLVNFVVDKVDKREKKFLRFNTDDDDNSSLVAINIGFIKLNSRKHK